MRFKTLSIIAGIAFSGSSLAQNANNIQLPEVVIEPARKTINIPDIFGYKTLKCDFHIHTVFSDGIVWPTFRVDEAWQEGLDAIAITDHIEGNPSKEQVTGDHNSSYEIALPRAFEKNIILIHAGEITRDMPPGHFNALFLNDVNPLDKEDYMDAFKAASEQGAYIIWNHPGWKSQQPDTCKWWDIHDELLKKGFLHGIEVFNEKEWYPIALDWCIEKELAVTAASDIHGISAGFYDFNKFHRPMTLVFAKELTLESLREAVFANRTVAWFGNNLAGKEEYLKAIFEAAVEIRYHNETKNGTNYIIKNSSDVPFLLTPAIGKSFNIPANGETIVTFSRNFKNDFEVKNLYVKGAENLKISLKLNR